MRASVSETLNAMLRDPNMLGRLRDALHRRDTVIEHEGQRYRLSYEPTHYQEPRRHREPRNWRRIILVTNGAFWFVSAFLFAAVGWEWWAPIVATKPPGPETRGVVLFFLHAAGMIAGLCSYIWDQD